MNAEQRSRAGRAVADRIAEMNAATTTVARAAGVSPKTLRSLMHGDRWPTNTVQAAIEAVLRRRPGEIAAYAVGVHDGGRALLDSLSDVELAAVLVRRLTERERRNARMRATDRRRSPSARPRQGQRCDLLWRVTPEVTSELFGRVAGAEKPACPLRRTNIHFGKVKCMIHGDEQALSHAVESWQLWAKTRYPQDRDLPGWNSVMLEEFLGEVRGAIMRDDHVRLPGEYGPAADYG
jgi:transcriptional regulator with XRE-family HTH domain